MEFVQKLQQPTFLLLLFSFFYWRCGFLERDFEEKFERLDYQNKKDSEVLRIQRDKTIH